MTKYLDIKQTCLSSKPHFLLLNSEDFLVNNTKQEVSHIDFQFLAYCSAHSWMSKTAISIFIIPNLPHRSVLIPLSFSSFFPPSLPRVLAPQMPPPLRPGPPVRQWAWRRMTSTLTTSWLPGNPPTRWMRRRSPDTSWIGQSAPWKQSGWYDVIIFI